MTALQRMPELVEVKQFVDMFHEPLRIDHQALPDMPTFESIFDSPGHVVFVDTACKLLRVLAGRQDISFDNWERALADECVRRDGGNEQPWLRDHKQSPESRLLLLRALCLWCLDIPPCRQVVDDTHPDDLVGRRRARPRSIWPWFPFVLEETTRAPSHRFRQPPTTQRSDPVGEDASGRLYWDFDGELPLYLLPFQGELPV